MATITTNRKWYKKPEIIIAVFGVIFPILASYIIGNIDNDKRELTVTYSQTEPLISENNEIINSLKIIYDSAKVDNISKITFKIKNTGNVSLLKSDFADGPININIKYLNNSTSLILQTRKKDDAGQQNSVLDFKNLKSKSTILYYPSLINVNDEITLEAYLLNTPITEILLTGKIFNGNVLGPKSMESKGIKMGYKTFILSLNSFFPDKWFTISTFITIFFFTALSTLFQYASVNDPGQVDVKWLMRMMATVTGIISVFLLILIVSVLVYV